MISHRGFAALFAAPLFLLASLATPRIASAVPTPGFVEDFPGTSVQGWGGLADEENPGTGGVGGVGDGFLRISRPVPERLAAVSFGPEYNGDWIASGVQTIKLWLNDVDGNEALEMHIGLGPPENFWHSNQGLIPPEHAWAPFHVGLVEAEFTRIIGAGTFEDALRFADRLLVRHDVAPYIQSPDFIQGDVGVDRIELLSAPLAAPSPSEARLPVELRPPAPNPSRGPVVLAFDTHDSGPVRLEVRDAMGRRVRTVELAGFAPGTRTWRWDGLDDRGRLAAPGVYRVRAVGASGGTSQPLVRIR